MQFLTLQQTEAQHFRTEYRYSTAAGWACFLVSMALTTAGGFFLYRAWVARTMAGLLLAGWFTFWFGLFAMIARGTLRDRLRKTNWLVRTQTNGMLMKFRSYLNHHFDESDPVVVQILYSEIEFVRVHRVRQTQPGSERGGDTTRFMRFAEFRMRDQSVVKELDARLAEERNRQAPQQGRLIHVRKKAFQYPVQVSNDGFVRIEWHVWPRLGKFIEDLTGQVQIQPAAKSRVDYGSHQKKTLQERENALMDLIAAGDRIGAIRLIRQIYGYDLLRATQFCDELSQKPRPDHAR